VDYESGLLKIGETSKQAKSVVDQVKKRNLDLILRVDQELFLEE
jgi:hypothetical protein